MTSKLIETREMGAGSGERGTPTPSLEGGRGGERGEPGAGNWELLDKQIVILSRFCEES